MLDQTVFNKDNQIHSFDNSGNLIINAVFDLAKNKVVINDFNISEGDTVNNLKQFIDICRSKKIDQIDFNMPNTAYEVDEQQDVADLLNLIGFTVIEEHGILNGFLNLNTH